jgi:hypothetical protein
MIIVNHVFRQIVKFGQSDTVAQVRAEKSSIM